MWTVGLFVTCGHVSCGAVLLRPALCVVLGNNKSLELHKHDMTTHRTFEQVVMWYLNAWFARKFYTNTRMFVRCAFGTYVFILIYGFSALLGAAAFVLFAVHSFCFRKKMYTEENIIFNYEYDMTWLLFQLRFKSVFQESISKHSSPSI